MTLFRHELGQAAPSTVSGFPSDSKLKPCGHKDLRGPLSFSAKVLLLQSLLFRQQAGMFLPEGLRTCCLFSSEPPVLGYPGVSSPQPCRPCSGTIFLDSWKWKPPLTPTCVPNPTTRLDFSPQQVASIAPPKSTSWPFELVGGAWHKSGTAELDNNM